mmetsp:Transcript_10202/g.22683  ORF Transcript_10202/g.22683 Transcript_10202/m.22683 type:complete len:1127 (-) Transcript_10202:57-3437(-)
MSSGEHQPSGQLKDDTMDPPSTSTAAAHTPREDVQCSDKLAVDEGTVLGTVEPERRSRHWGGELLVDAGKKVAKTTCNILFGKRGTTTTSDPTIDRHEEDANVASHQKPNIDPKAATAQVLDLSGDGEGDDVGTREKMEELLGGNGGDDQESHDQGIGKSDNKEYAVQNDQTHDVVDLTIDESSSDDVEENNNDVMELFSMVRGNQNASCSICKTGGEMICCSFCERVFHFQCHIPSISSVPSSQWKCSECSAACNLSRSLPERRRHRLGYLNQYNLRGQSQQVASRADTLSGEDSDVDGETTRRESTTAKASCRRNDAQKKEELFEGEHSDECYICYDGGELVLCDFCEKSFHQQCHIPPLNKVPDDDVWKCCECRAAEMTKRFKCGECPACMRRECRKCRYCLDSKKYGGSGILHQTCIEKRCPNKRYAQPATVTPVQISRQRERRTMLQSNDDDDDYQPTNQNVTEDDESYEEGECSAGERTEKSVCGECDGCVRPNCGECGPCLDREILRMINCGRCDLKRCLSMSYAQPEVGVDGPTKPDQNGKRPRPSKQRQNKKRTRRPKNNNEKQTRKHRSCPVNNHNLVQSPFEAPASSNDSRVGGLKVMSITLGNKKKKPNCFEVMFKDRTYEVKVAINETPPDSSFRHDGRLLELVSAKLPREKCGRFNVKEMKLMYIATEGPNLPKINLQTQLNRLCSFSSLGPVKAVARLSHLQPEAQHILFTDASKIEFISENGNEGSGFFPRGFFDGQGPRRNFDSIQVRLIGPKIGLAKGMILVKDGITNIQLPPSMIKAPPSEACDKTWVAVVIKNIFPCERNVQLGRYLHPDEDACNSWKKNKQKELSEMHQRMLIGFGVKKEDIHAYARRSTSPDHLKHAHLKGAADPTMKIPEDKIFISGYTTNSNGERDLFGNCFNQVYCSRSPAVSPYDAKILSVVAERTEDMSGDEWDLLCSYKWGTVIFGAPRTRLSAPLPCCIADGDLDGDDYFICWDDEIVAHLLHAKDKLTSKSRKLLLELKLPDKTEHSLDKTTSFSQGGDNWLNVVQDKMLDFSTQNAESHITGKLYSLCIAASKKSGGKIDIYDEDAVAYAQAYKDSLDIQKHGGKIFLPNHLHDSISLSLRTLLL